MTKSKKGFTIIEVVLVLAIAGLIFLMVFIALPALQRSQRNTRRRQDMARILAQFTEYSSNNNGQVPLYNDSTNGMQLDNFVNKYVGADGQGAEGSDCVGDQFCDPDGTPYKFTSTSPIDGGGADWSNMNWPNDHQIGYWTSAKCGEDEGHTSYASGKSNIAIMYVLEGGAIYCGDNQ